MRWFSAVMLQPGLTRGGRSALARWRRPVKGTNIHPEWIGYRQGVYVPLASMGPPP